MRFLFVVALYRARVKKKTIIKIRAFANRAVNAMCTKPNMFEVKICHIFSGMRNVIKICGQAVSSFCRLLLSVFEHLRLMAFDGKIRQGKKRKEKKNACRI